ncbi:hypothetical protein CRM22_008994, partial [Opisthorchis felineus]
SPPAEGFSLGTNQSDVTCRDWKLSACVSRVTRDFELADRTLSLLYGLHFRQLCIAEPICNQYDTKSRIFAPQSGDSL